MPRPFVRHSSRVVLETPIFRLREDRAAHPESGHVASYYVMENSDWVNMVAVTDAGELVMVRQFRHGTGAVELELPAGMIEAGEAPLAAAARELEEETGFRAARWELIGQVRPNLGLMTNTCYTALAEGCVLSAATNFDAGEDIEVVLVRPEELRALVTGGQLRNALGLTAVLWWMERRGRVAW